MARKIIIDFLRTLRYNYLHRVGSRHMFKIFVGLVFIIYAVAGFSSDDIYTILTSIVISLLGLGIMVWDFIDNEDKL